MLTGSVYVEYDQNAHGCTYELLDQGIAPPKRG